MLSARKKYEGKITLLPLVMATVCSRAHFRHLTKTITDVRGNKPIKACSSTSGH